jgi:hypothetical protein
MRYIDALDEAVAIDRSIDDLYTAVEEDGGEVSTDIEVLSLLENLSVASDALVRYLQNKI